MRSQIPAYYSRLGPFRKVFQTGNPILTYHKLGPRPTQARLKGLYVSQSLFQRQLGELRTAGYTHGLLQTAAGPCDSGRIAITFDDGYVNVLRYGVKPLAQNAFRAVQFIVANLLGKTNQWDVAVGEAPEPLMDIAQIREWLAAGHEIGSHTLNHPYLTRISRGDAAEEIKSSRKKLEDLFGRPVEHFCYPYGDWNQITQDLAREAGYKTACTTEPGVNTSATSPFALRRFTARYPSRNLKAIWARIRSGSE